MRRILGIDPGLQYTGWGIIEQQGNNLKYIACGTICSDSKQELSDRLLTLSEGITKVVEAYSPGECAIEETFVNKNSLTSLKLGHARGALIVSVSLAGLPLKEYAATQVKKTIVGVGRADKGQIEAMVKILLPTAEMDSADAADALAVAICHSHQSNSYANNLEAV